MANIFLIAGPPGIGKSTSGFGFINPDLDIINEDEIRFKYKELGYPDFREYSVHRTRDTIRTKLIRSEDFALELNLGFQHQYDYALSIKKFNRDNKLKVILFFTDNVALCKERARLRHLSGKHLVDAATVQQMYDNTLPLLKSHIDQIDDLIFVNARSDNNIEYLATYNKELNVLDVENRTPQWFRTDIEPFLDGHINLREFFPGGLGRGDDDDLDTGPRRGPKR